MIRINQVNIQANQKNTEQILQKKASQILKISEKEIKSLHIVRQSIDARKKPEIFYSYVIDVAVEKEEKIVKRGIGEETIDLLSNSGINVKEWLSGFESVESSL